MPQNENERTESAPAAAEPGTLDFERAIEELEGLVDQMEAGQLSVEASLAAYERGVHLARHCQAALRHAELKISRLDENDQLEPLDPDSFDDD